jgi:hypothetical protein
MKNRTLWSRALPLALYLFLSDVSGAFAQWQQTGGR